ncbi:MAG: glycosyltransferase [Anaerolineales bacterium]|nr:MAG: glycosyltransferase [Anaerolineales bacterium]
MFKLGIIVPCYNEGPLLRETTRQLSNVLERLVAAEAISPDSRIYYVDDGSTDSTWTLVETLCDESECVAGIKLSRNQGHQNALLAGLFTVEADALITVDADLQDDIDVIDKMVENYKEGADIVYGVRADRSADTLFKRATANTFYRMMSMLGVDTVSNHADYRLMSRRAIEALKEFHEVNLFLRGIVPLIGFKSAIVSYKRSERMSGQSKYTLRKMLSLALEGVTSFSVTPLRIITGFGLLVFVFSISMILYVLSIKMFTNTAVPGWASTVLPIYLLGGIQIFCIGIIGEYIGRIYREVKARPRYIIERYINL